MSDELNESAISGDVIESLKALDDGDGSLLGELIDLFLSDTPVRMRDLERALASDDAKSVEEAAHSLKSSCGNLGAMGLSTLFKEIEMFGRDRDLSQVASLVDRSNDEFQRVESALRAELS